MYHDFVENWFSHSTESFRRGTLRFSENNYRKILWIGRGYHDFLSKLFCLSVPKKIPKRTLLFQKSSGLKKLHRMVYHDFVVKWLSHSTESFRRGTLLFSEIVLYRKSFWIGGGYHDFLSKLFCLTVPKKFLVGPFCFRNFQDWKNCIKWCITILSKIDFLTVPKSFVGEPFVFQEISSIEKLYG